MYSNLTRYNVKKNSNKKYINNVHILKSMTMSPYHCKFECQL